EAMDPSTITPTSFLVSDANGVHLSGPLVIDTATNTATFSPVDLAPNTRYHMVVTTDAMDIAGNAMDSFVAFFVTGAK
ncbi:MAG: hypothetical protein JWQ21_1465, partial [Herminiimonas sp.]|nr:hypothetical protein [Herminiimonas sp.]